MHDSSVSGLEPVTVVEDGPAGKGSWLLLTHHIPPHPAYFRVKVRRRLTRLGAVLLKNSVYVLPHSEDGLEDFQWLRQEIEREGGEATICEAVFLDGVTDARLVAEFSEARAEDYAEVVRSALPLVHELQGPAVDESSRASLFAKVSKIERRLQEVVSMDFFGSHGRATAENALRDLRKSLKPSVAEPEGVSAGATARARDGRPLPRGCTWVTRKGLKVDRIASAWLIRRFIDAAARFRFVPPQGYEPRAGEVRFDMYEGEYTHVGDLCTFETLLDRFALADPALVALGQIVHDIDCKDAKFCRAETVGVASLISGIASAHADDDARLDRGASVLDDLYEHFRTAGP